MADRRSTLEPLSRRSETARQVVVATGGVLAALAASSCCMLPLVFFGLGVSGAWIGRLTALAPYQPIFIAMTLGFLGHGYWLVYRRPKDRCAEGEGCAQPLPSRLVVSGLWLATALVAVAIGFPYVAPILLQ